MTDVYWYNINVMIAAIQATASFLTEVKKKKKFPAVNYSRITINIFYFIKYMYSIFCMLQQQKYQSFAYTWNKFLLNIPMT